MFGCFTRSNYEAQRVSPTLHILSVFSSVATNTEDCTRYQKKSIYLDVLSTLFLFWDHPQAIKR